MRIANLCLIFISTVICILLAGSNALAADEPEPQGTLQQQYDDCNERCNTLLRNYQEAALAGDIDEPQLRLLRNKCQAALAEMIEFDLQLRQHRIEAARLRLDTVESKLKHSRKIVDQLVEQEFASRLTTLSATTRFSTPGDLLDRLVECENFADYVELLSDRCVDSLAAAMLISATQMVGMAMRSEQYPGGLTFNNPEQLKEILDFLEASKRKNPPPLAVAAYDRLVQFQTEQASFLFEQKGSPRDPSLPDFNLNQVTAALGILKSPRKFVVGCNELLEKLSGEPTPDIATEMANFEWKLESVDGDVAIALLSDRLKPHRVEPNRIELRRVNGSWEIANLVGFNEPQPLRDEPADTDSGDGSLSPAVEPSTHSTSAKGLTQPSRLPTYDGHSIDWWLKKYWAGAAQPSNDETVSTKDMLMYSKSLDAISALRDKASSDQFILLSMKNWYATTENEFDRSRLGFVGKCILSIAGERHQQAAINYLFDLAAQCPPASPEKFKSRFLGQDNYFDVFSTNRVELGSVKISKDISRWDQELAAQLAEKLERGNSRQKELAITILLVHLDVGTTSEQTVRNWFGEFKSMLVPALVSASKDADDWVADYSISLLTMAPELAKERLTSAIQEPNIQWETKLFLIESLAKADPENDLPLRAMVELTRSIDPDDVGIAIDQLSNLLKADQFVDLLVELLKDRNWGKDGRFDAYLFDNENTRQHVSPRNYAVSFLGTRGKSAPKALPILEAELESSDNETITIAKKSIALIKSGGVESGPESSDAKPKSDEWKN